jgi:hypothetical protein
VCSSDLVKCKMRGGMGRRIHYSARPGFVNPS